MSFPLNDKTSTIDTRTLSVSNTMTQPRVPDVTLWPPAPAGSTVYDEATSEPYFYNGAAWLPISGGGAEDLAATLALGNTSGANNIVMSAGQGIDGATTLALTAQAGDATLTSATASIVQTAEANFRIIANTGFLSLSSNTSTAITAVTSSIVVRSLASTVRLRGNSDATVESDNGDVVLLASAGDVRGTADGNVDFTAATGNVVLTATAGTASMTATAGALNLTSSDALNVTSTTNTVNVTGQQNVFIQALDAPGVINLLSNLGEIALNAPVGNVRLTATDTDSEISVEDHLIALGTAPTIAGGTATIDPKSTDIAGFVSAWDNDPQDDIEVVFARPFPVGTKPIIMITPGNQGAVNAGVFISEVLTDETRFTVRAAGINDNLAFYYHVIGVN